MTRVRTLKRRYPVWKKGITTLFLSDIQMPEMDGFELVQQIRESQNQQIKSLPVIALSARDDMHEKEYQEAGFSAYLNKPYTPEQLYSRVNDLLGCAIETKQSTTQTSDKNTPYNLDMIMVFADNDKDAANQIIGSFYIGLQDQFPAISPTSGITRNGTDCQVSTQNATHVQATSD